MWQCRAGNEPASFGEITVLKEIAIGAVYLQSGQKYVLTSFKQITVRSMVFHIPLTSQDYQKVFLFYLKKSLNNDLSKRIAYYMKEAKNRSFPKCNYKAKTVTN